MCAEKYGLFCDRPGGLEPRPCDAPQTDHLEYYELLGKILVLALSYGEVIGVQFSAVFCKVDLVDLGEACDLVDLKSVEPEVYKNW